MEEIATTLKAAIGNARTVSIGELAVSSDPEDILVAYGVGSCVAICMYDESTHKGGMLHALLPTAPAGNNRKSTKFVDQGIPLLVESLMELGARRGQLTAYICGGARVLNAAGFANALDTGQRNVETAGLTLQAAGIPLAAQAIGGEVGRTVKLFIENGQVTVRSVGQREVPI
jgi:chemotaxis protein CheD